MVCGWKIRSLLALHESVKLVFEEVSPANETNVETPPAAPATGSSKRKALEVITINTGAVHQIERLAEQAPHR